MAAAKKTKKQIESYSHEDKERPNNPPAGLVSDKTDPDTGEKMTYEHDPHLDPQLQWAGKAENPQFEVPILSLHVHERIDPRTIIEAVKKQNGSDSHQQASLFAQEREIPLRQAIEFYQHSHNWTNRLIAGDSLLVMNSLLQKENMSGKVQCVYMDPPYGIKYGSNFQPFVNKRDVKDGKDDDLTIEPETIKAFRDTWELGVHSYLSYMRDRLLLAREMLADSGSCFVQISDENVHHIREIMDEVFGPNNFVAQITYKVTSGFERKIGPRRIENYLIWYAKQKEQCKFHRSYKEKSLESVDFSLYKYAEENGIVRTLTKVERENPEKISADAKIFMTLPLHTMGTQKREPRDFDGQAYTPPPNTQWRHKTELFQEMIKGGRIIKEGNIIRSKYYLDDFPFEEHNTVWLDTGPELSKSYVVQTTPKVIQRCILMTTDPGDLVFDPTCGSGTTAYVAEQWGRRWITCDTSRVALTLAKQRLMTTSFDYYQLAHTDEGVGSGFRYKTVPHVTLKSIANDEPPAEETLYDQPLKNTKKSRVTGPFTVEAVPSPIVLPIEAAAAAAQADPVEPADNSVARSGETSRHNQWCDELLRTGIRGKAGQRINFSRIESLPCSYIVATAETNPEPETAESETAEPETAEPETNKTSKKGTKKGTDHSSKPQQVAISFGPEHAPLDAKWVELALQEAQTLVPKPEIVVFAAFQFDSEAAKDIDETNWPGVVLLKVQMNADMQTEDLKKKSTASESFWLVGQPDIEMSEITEGDNKGKMQVVVRGFDYFNTKTSDLESGGQDRIAVWMLDTDYDGRSLYPTQVFFPMADAKGGWSRIAKNLKAEIDEELIEAYRGTTSLPFELGENQRIAVKIVDDRGIESLKVISTTQGNK